METPWGVAEKVENITDGIVRITTSRHGGIQLVGGKLTVFRDKYPDVKLHAGEGWFEEDCDWCLVAITFPEFFNNQDIFFAVATCRHWHKSVSIDTAVMERALEFERSIADCWQVGSQWTGNRPGSVCVSLNRGTESRVATFKGWPDKPFYTDDELIKLQVTFS